MSSPELYNIKFVCPRCTGTKLIVEETISRKVVGGTKNGLGDTFLIGSINDEDRSIEYHCSSCFYNLGSHNQTVKFLEDAKMVGGRIKK